MQITTIQLQTPTKEILNKLKENYSVSTYDEVITTLIKRKEKSMYGVLKNANISTKQFIKEVRKDRRKDDF